MTDSIAKDFICPSILAADFMHLGEEIAAVLDAGADMIHFDVMDNHYVPNLTIGPLVCQSLRRSGITAPIDAHLMVQPVDDLIVAFAEAGADWISFHPEASADVRHSLGLIHDKGCKSGLVFNPDQSVAGLNEYIQEVDLVLIMSVHPGFGGQAFIPSALDKLKQVRDIIDKSNRQIRLEIDGGIKIDNIAAAKRAGADTFVAGSAIFGSIDYKNTMDLMRAQLDAQ